MIAHRLSNGLLGASQDCVIQNAAKYKKIQAHTVSLRTKTVCTPKCADSTIKAAK